MKIYEVLDFLNTVAPLKLAESYDNVGLLVGNENDEVTGIVVALDCVSETINNAIEIGANLIVTHHPIIFTPLKKVTDESIVYKLLTHKISVISLHTNLDIADNGVNDTLCNVLELTNVKKISTTESPDFFIRLGELQYEFTAEDFAVYLKQKLGGMVKYVANKKLVSTVAVCSGSGGSFLCDAISIGADAFVTADVKHNVFIEAAESGISIYDAGHFNTEDVIVSVICKKLSNEFIGVPIIENHFSQIESI